VIERTVIGWLAELAGMPDGSDGLLLSGGSWSNLCALTTAVHSRLGPHSLKEGLSGAPQPAILAAGSAHFSIQRAAKVLGVGTANVVPIALDDRHRMDVADLRAKLAEIAAAPDRAVCAVVATAGTTGLGAVDPLVDIAEVCREAGVWMHVDAAYGGAALLAKDLQAHLAGIGEADSITIDLHKWAYLAFDASALLFRDPDKARRIFAVDADYVQPLAGRGAEEYNFFEISPDLSRRARALPAYLAWRHYGIDVLGRNISHNAACIRYLAALVEEAPDMELVTYSSLSIACFRYCPPAMAGNAAEIDRLNESIVDRLDGSGDFALSPMAVDSRPVIRVCICSHATEARHMRELVETVRNLGEELAA
jgi:aromatic-L-amino-acid/L-tryptophan decarboxylase